MMQEAIEKVARSGLEAIAACQDHSELENLRQKILGRKGELTDLLKGLGKLAPEERKSMGQLANKVKGKLQQAFEEQEAKLLAEASVLDGTPDLTVPGLALESGGLHPITKIRYELDDAFRSLNFTIYDESEISTEERAFDHLNFPPNHPARETMDTYWIAGTENKQAAERLCMRPHLTGLSVEYLRRHGAPARFIYPGRVYRNESTDNRHERAFFQYEALIVEKHFPFAAGRLLIKTILEKVFHQEVAIRMRAGFFPFVEPGFEIDMQCMNCHGKGCRLCKNVGWIEVMPGGTPHPNVLRAAGLDPEVWTGFYINIGLDRLAMMRYGITDVRLMHSADLRFLEQFR